MSSQEIEQIAAAPAPSWLGQATAVEQSRAVAEVQAAVVVARQFPRDLAAATADMRDSCRQEGLAERAFYSYKRGGQTVTGASVHLARELARCWGNVQYGISEMRRDDAAGISEMQAWAWDLQTNTRSSQMFIVPHKRDRTGGAKLLTEMRDIYENNANQGARRVREAIFAVLPPWFTEEAKTICVATIRGGGGKALPQRIADAKASFERLGVSLDRIEQKIGRPSAKWNEYDVAKLVVSYKSIERGEISADDEFPPQRVTAEELTTPPSRKTSKARPAEAPAPDDSPDDLLSGADAAGEETAADQPE